MDHNYIPFMGFMSVYTPLLFIIFMYFILFAIYYLYSCALFSKRLPILFFYLGPPHILPDYIVLHN